MSVAITITSSSNSLANMMLRFLRAVAVLLLITSAISATAATPQFRSSTTLNGAGTLNFPAGSVSSDWLVMYVISTSAVATPTGWTKSASYNWTTFAYYSYVFTRQKGTDTNVTVSPAQGGAMILAYQNVTGIGAIGTFKESGGSSLPMNSITPQSAGSLILGILSDRDMANPTPATGFTTRLNFITTYFGQNFADKAYGSTSPTGNPTWGQSTTYAAIGVLVELLPTFTQPSITAVFSPANVMTGSTSTLTFSVGNSNGSTMTNANFTATLANMSVASSTTGGTCAGVTNSPTLTTGATALNLMIPNLPVGGCTVSLQVTSTNVGTNPLMTSGVSTAQTPTAGPPSNTANLTVTSTPQPATIQAGFAPAWMATGATSTLTFTLGSPSQVALTNAQFTATLTNMTLADTAIGGTCVGTTSSPTLLVGANALNMTVPTIPGVGCTVSIQVTSTTLGSNLLASSGVTVSEVSMVGIPANAAYLTITPLSVGFSYVHADHLGTPRAITRPSDNAKVWEYENTEPFGNSAPNQNPSGLGNFVYNLRESWQYHDSEVGTNYNYFRDYDPGTGRYVESDPIGLRGGLNTYAYVGGNPLSFVDDFGLCACDCSKQKRCKGTARALKGNDKLIGKNGPFSTKYPNNPVPVTSGSAAIIPSQWGKSKEDLRPYIGKICGESEGFPIFDEVTDIVGNKKVPRNPCGAKNVRDAMRCLFPGDLIVEVPGSKDYGRIKIDLVIPKELSCPEGTSEAPCS
jgi:RHS repeat-associated protein